MVFPESGTGWPTKFLWRAHVLPRKRVAKLTLAERRAIFRETKLVVRHSLRTLGRNFSDLPKSWLIHRAWKRKQGICPNHETPLRHATIGGRTTAWCPDAVNPESSLVPINYAVT